MLKYLPIQGSRSRLAVWHLTVADCQRTDNLLDPQTSAAAAAATATADQLMSNRTRRLTHRH